MLRWTVHLFIKLILLQIFLALKEDGTASASGVFELRIEEFVNGAGKDSNGNCCSGFESVKSRICSNPCRTAFNICLKHFQSKVKQDSCTYGYSKTPVVGHNTFQVEHTNSEENIVKMKFTFTWPGTFSLIVDALHVDERNSSVTKPISQVITQGQIAVNSDWRTETHKQNNKALRYSYRVVCDLHYYGVGCSEYCRPRDDVFGHYTCNRDGKKVCLRGWDGSSLANGGYCTKPICREGCNMTNGDCKKPFECKCKSGWHGDLCDKCRTHPACIHGTCQDIFECNCDSGWGGKFCNLDLIYCSRHKPCRNGARCRNVEQGSYECDCLPGYTGRDCSTEIDECEPNPCRNGGKCTHYINKYVCDCQKNYYGDNCQFSNLTCADKPCQNGADCKDQYPQYVCKCPRGYKGVNCETNTQLCPTFPCQNGGKCQRSGKGFECNCPKKFKGHRCERLITDCNHDLCGNEGLCVTGKNGFSCRCKNGYYGRYCELIPAMCARGPCKNSGICSVVHNQYICECKPGYDGRNCEREDPCASKPCKNGGQCTRHTEEGYECKCEPGFIGIRCEKMNFDFVQPGFIKESESGQKATIYLLSKSERSELSSTQWVAISMGSGFLVLIIITLAGCVAYHRQTKSTYIRGTIAKAFSINGMRNRHVPTPSMNPEHHLASRNIVPSINPPHDPSNVNLVPGIVLSPLQDEKTLHNQAKYSTRNSGSWKMRLGEERTQYSPGGNQHQQRPSHKRRTDILHFELTDNFHRNRAESSSSHSRRSLNESVHPPAGVLQGDADLRLPTYQEACIDEKVTIE